MTEGTVTTFTNSRRVQPATLTADDTVYEFGEYETPPGAGLSESAAPTTSISAISAGVVWEDDYDHQSLRPKSVQLILMGDGEPAGEPKTVKAPSWKATWYDLPAQNTDGNPINYTVKQVESLSAYTTICNHLTVTNTLKTGRLNAKVSLSGAPEWADMSGLQLAIYGPDLLGTIRYEQMASGTFDFDKVPEGAYLIRVTNADTLIEGYVMDADNSKVADAVYVSSGESPTLELEYTWKLPELLDAEADEDYDPYANIGNLSFDILGPDGWIMRNLTYAQFTDGKYEIPDLKPGVYTVVERTAETLVKYYTLTSNSITGQTVEVKPGETTTVKLFNRYVPLPTPEPEAEFIDIPMTVTWNDNNNADGNRPESFMVRLYADGVEVDSHVLTDAEDWQYTFMNEPRYREDYKTEIVYTINEDAIPMYAATVNGYNIVNDYAPELTSVSVSMVWNDNNNADGNRPNAIGMRLSDGQKDVKMVVLSEENGWSYTVNNLPTVVNGQPAQYTWEAQQVLGYVLENVEQQGNKTVFTNGVRNRPDSPENNPTITPKNRTYDETEKPLVTVSGELTGGTMQYALGTDATTAPTDGWSADIPTGTDAGTYYVWYMVVGDENHSDSEAACVTTIISNRSSSSGSSGGGAAPATNPVKVPATAAGTASHGKVTSSAASAKAGDKVTITVDSEAGYQTASVTVTDANGKAVPVTKNADGTYSFTMPSTAVTVTPTFIEVGENPVNPENPENPDVSDASDVSHRFVDVGRDAWYHDAVQWAVDKGLMNGTGDTTFEPNGSATRAMVVTMLWRLAGEPAASGETGFADVSSDAWYAQAVAWAVETGAVKGTSDTAFSPNAPVTREQLTAILYRYAQAQGKGFTGAWMFLLDYPDADQVSEYADEAMHWMTMHGIITGMGDGTLAPKDSATRAQIATIFMRFCGENAE